MASCTEASPEWDEKEPQFPEPDGPAFLLGTYVLVDATQGLVGEDALGDVPRRVAAGRGRRPLGRC
jgi:hypothetical protein